MRAALLTFALAVFAFPSAVAAEDAGIGLPPACGDPAVASLSVVDCETVDAVPSLDGSSPESAAGVAAFAAAAGVAQELPSYCVEPATVIFYTSTDWVRLAQTMAADASPCAEYYFRRTDQAVRLRRHTSAVAVAGGGTAGVRAIEARALQVPTRGDLPRRPATNASWQGRSGRAG
jgi:hypothetical protein